MNTNNTPDLQALIELSEKCTDGPWEAYGGTNHGRVQTADVVVCDGSVPNFMQPEDAKFIAALVNWFRANHSALTAPTLPAAGGGDGLDEMFPGLQSDLAKLTTGAAGDDPIREALASVVRATRAYLPPDGISAHECISRVLAATDNSRINAALGEVK